MRKDALETEAEQKILEVDKENLVKMHSARIVMQELTDFFGEIIGSYEASIGHREEAVVDRKQRAWDFADLATLLFNLEKELKEKKAQTIATEEKKE